MRISIYGVEQQQRLLKLKEVYGASTVTKMVELLIDATYEQIESESLGGSNDETHQQREAA